MRSLLDPLFNRKIFTAVCLVLSVSAVIGLTFFSLGPPPDTTPESEEVVSDANGSIELETPYQHGFRKGYDAFLKQTGRYIPRPSVSAKHTASYSMNDEDVSRGYIDGYHKATEMGQCPRGLYE